MTYGENFKNFDEACSKMRDILAQDYVRAKKQKERLVEMKQRASEQLAMLTNQKYCRG